jgi:peptidoglycan hydrolase-like protein with peptidoglycan-binding domain
MGSIKPGWWIASLAVAVLLLSVGFGMGRRAGEQSARQAAALAPAGAPLATIQIEPIQPQEELAAISAETVGTIEPVPSGAPEDGSTRTQQIQLALQRAGFSPGPADGRLGPRTRSAIKNFQLAHGLKSDGKVGPMTWNKLESFISAETTSQE